MRGILLFHFCGWCGLLCSGPALTPSSLSCPLGEGKGVEPPSPHLEGGVGAEQRPVLPTLLEPVRAEARLGLNAIFVRVPFSSVNANPELQAIRMTS